jgi:hypothetical protein
MPYGCPNLRSRLHFGHNREGVHEVHKGYVVAYGVAKVFNREARDTNNTNWSLESPPYTYPTAFKLLALCCHILHATLYAAPSLSYCL